MAFYVGCINGGGIGLAPAKTGWQDDTNFSLPEPITEWDISRICQAGQEKDTPVMMRIKHANPASLTSSLLDIGVFLIKVPTVEDEATVDAIIDVFYYPPTAYAASKEVRNLRLYTRHRSWMIGQRTQAKNRLQVVLAGYNLASPVTDLFGVTGREYLAEVVERLRPAAQRVVVDN